MAGRFAGKGAFITGASSGIGAATAIAFAREGARVAILARRLDKLEATRQMIEDAGGEALALACDVTDRASLDAAAAKTVETFGGIDVVLANAGFGVSGLMTRLETTDFRRQFETNVFGLLDTVYATLPYLKESKGRLGLVGSVSGRLSTPSASPYTASKFAVVALAECFYYELADLGVSVTCINPGFVASEIRSVNNAGELTGKPDPVPQWLVMPAEKAARQIVHALYRRKPEVVLTKHGKVSVFLSRHFPRLTRTAIRLATRNRLYQIEKRKPGGVAE